MRKGGEAQRRAYSNVPNVTSEEIRRHRATTISRKLDALLPFLNFPTAVIRCSVSENVKVIWKMWRKESRLLVAVTLLLCLLAATTFILSLSRSASAYVNVGEAYTKSIPEIGQPSDVSSPKEDIVPFFAKNASVRQSMSDASNSYGPVVLRKRMLARTCFTAASPTAAPAARRGERVASTVYSRTEVECDAHSDPRRRVQ